MLPFIAQTLIHLFQPTYSPPSSFLRSSTLHLLLFSAHMRPRASYAAAMVSSLFQLALHSKSRAAINLLNISRDWHLGLFITYVFALGFVRCKTYGVSICMVGRTA